jgi:hypothetical protein
MIDLCDCDVINKEKLALFRTKLSKWEKWFSSESRHSILIQFLDMIWFDTVFRTINEARRLHIEGKSKQTGLNGPLMELLDRGFVASQAFAIRRLTDPSYHQPGKEVISLGRFIDDIESSISFFTRENYICHDGTLYDWPSNKEASRGWYHWNHKHKNFDSLSGTHENDRKRSDKIKMSVLKKSRKNLKICDEMRTYTNRFLAHASDPEKKPNMDEILDKITLYKFDDCYRAITEIAWFISAVILYESGLGGIPVPQYDQLINLNKPIITSKNLNDLQEFWTKRSLEVHNWELYDWQKKFGVSNIKGSSG